MIIYLVIFTVLGVLSAVIFVVADSIYLKDTIYGGTKPQRTSWGM